MKFWIIGLIICSALYSSAQTIHPETIRWGLKAAAAKRNIVVSSGLLVSWGKDVSGNTVIPPFGSNQIVACSLTVAGTAALDANGYVSYWGAALDKGIPEALSNGNCVAISGGHSTYHTLAIDRNGSCQSFGSTANSGCVAGPPGTSNNVVQVAVGDWHNMCLRGDGQVIAWGYNVSGQTNVPTTLSNVTWIAAGGNACFAVSNGTVVAWGASFGAVPADAQNSVVSVYAGNAHCLALRSDGRVVAWGDNAYGECNVPSLASNSVVWVAGGGRNSIAVRSDGTLVMWGANDTAQTSPFPPLASNSVLRAWSTMDNTALGKGCTIALRRTN